MLFLQVQYASYNETQGVWIIYCSIPKALTHVPEVKAWNVQSSKRQTEETLFISKKLWLQCVSGLITGNNFNFLGLSKKIFFKKGESNTWNEHHNVRMWSWIKLLAVIQAWLKLRREKINDLHKRYGLFFCKWIIRNLLKTSFPTSHHIFFLKLWCQSASYLLFCVLKPIIL